MGFGFIGMILFLGIIILLAMVLINLLFPAKRQPSEPKISPAVEILHQRYARGELSRDEYQKMLQTIQR